MLNLSAREHATELLIDARNRLTVIEVFKDGNDAHNVDAAIENVEDVLDQLGHYCAKQMRLYGPGEEQPVGSRLRHAWHILTTRR